MKREANDVAPPKGGWDSLKAQNLKAPPLPTMIGRPKVSGV